ncbi:Na/Pi cotransporter family protein [Aquamicrobium terrae]|uniref:Phosphate:Na+ symporter n=1 Tax=Aquamicrobium terrae TaxID=1324945 RepID=A0ABV2N3V5_9HYPH
MHLMSILIQLAGAIMLLLWAVRLVRTGIERAHGALLRDALRGASRGRMRAAFAGIVLAILLQSSTAVAMLAASFAATGTLGVAGGIAVMLGADVGSALVVQALSFDLDWLVPLLLFAGATMFLKFESRTIKQTGRSALGIAFILISLRMVGEATAPMRNSDFMPVIIAYLEDDAITAFLLAGLFTWLIHSSVASVLLLMSMAAQGVLPAEVALPMVLGINLGAGLIAAGLTRGQAVEARRIPAGNLLFRAAAAAGLLVASRLVEIPPGWFGTGVGRQVVNMHLAFNLVLLVACLPLTAAMEAATRKLVRDKPAEAADDPITQRISALDRSAIKVPNVALTSATRELLRMAETVDVMLRPVMDLFDSGDEKRIARIRALDQEVNRAHTEIKLYIAEVNRGSMSQEEARRGVELTGFAINLEYAGDIIAKNLLTLAEEKARKQLNFSREGLKELTELHERVLANSQIAMNVLVSGDLETARHLAAEKEHVRRLERESHERHLKRLQTGTTESLETSDIHLEALRALKEINSLLVSLAYPLLTQSGELLESRLLRTA